jgi:ribosomal protein L24E
MHKPHGNTGKHPSEETKAKISEALKNHVPWRTYSHKSSAEWETSRKQSLHKFARTPKGGWHTLRVAAKQRSIKVSLIFEDYLKLVESNQCHYCGGDLPPTGSGIDRKVSSDGYTLENCVPCCKVCNLIRGHDNISFEEMEFIIPILIKFRLEKAAKNAHND